MCILDQEYSYNFSNTIQKANLRPAASNSSGFGDENLGDRVPPVVAGGGEFAADAVKSAVNVHVPLSRPLLCVAGGGAARWARDVRAKLVVLFSACARCVRGRYGAGYI